VDAPETTDVPPHGPASTRFDCSGANLGSQAEATKCIGVPLAAHDGPRTRRESICYDGCVWKRVALRHGREFARHVVPAIVKPARTLWNEVIGFIFLCFGVIFGFKAVRYALDGDHTRLSFAVFCTVLMLWFGVGSFLRARKISRS
jgi:hypothetical protein